MLDNYNYSCFLEKNKPRILVITNQPPSILYTSANGQKNVSDDLDDMSTISFYMLFFGLSLMTLSLIYSKFPWELSSVPIFGSLLLSFVSLLGRRELYFYGGNQEEESYIYGDAYCYVYSHEYSYFYSYKHS